MAVLSESDLVKILRQKIEYALDENSAAAQANANAFKQFMLLPNGTEDADHASIQSADVNAMVTAVLAQMVISFSTDTVVTFDANDAEDEQRAKAESLAVNKIAIDQNSGFNVISDGVQNALLYRNGYLKVWWDKDINRYVVRHENIERADLPIAGESELAPDGRQIDRQIISYDPDKKQARVEVTETKKRLRMSAVAIDRFFIDPDWDERTLTNCPLVGEVHYKTRNDLVRMGVDADLVDGLQAVGRNSGNENKVGYRKQGNVDPLTRQMEICRVYEAYAWFAMDEDEDRAYLWRVWIADAGEAVFLLDPEAVSRGPYACGTAFPVANRHDGQSLAEKLYAVQEGKTELWRQWIDNVRNCSYGRYGLVVGQANEDDVLNPKAGGPIRIKSPSSIVPIPVLDVGQSIKFALEEFDKARTERGGAAVDMVGAEMQVAGDTAHGTERVYAAKELLLSYMTRNVAESMILNAFLLVHAELRDGGGGPINLKINGEWTPVDPASWPARANAQVTVGYSMGERMHMSGIYGAAIQLQQAALQAGMDGELVSKPGLYKLVTDWMSLNLIDNAESYWIDPSSPAAIQASQQKAEQAAQQAQQMQQAQQALLAVPEQIKAQAAAYKSDQELAFKYFDAVLKAQVDALKAETQGAVDVANAEREARTLQGANAGRAGAPGNGVDRGNSRGNGATPAKRIAQPKRASSGNSRKDRGSY